MSGSTTNADKQLSMPVKSASLTAVPQRIAVGSGSATGNPRNKCALQPGHSLMDWIRLGNSGEDLAGTGGRIVPVTSGELVKHNTREDAWMAIRGVVYNVTRYMDFHPGGVNELMRGVGRDATKLFEENHAWVNYQQLLSKCRIGPLRRSMVRIDANVLQSLQSKAKLKDECVEQSNLNEIVPRFDWTQRRGDITFYIYTAQLSNPGILLKRHLQRHNEIELCVQIDHNLYKYEFELLANVVWPPRAVKMSTESGKIELSFAKEAKEVTELWRQYGRHTVTKTSTVTSNGEEMMLDLRVVRRQAFNHDSFDLTLKGEELLLVPAIGYHLSLELPIEGQLVRRSYTPVPLKFHHLSPDEEQVQSESYNLHFLIKRYATANGLSARLSQCEVDGALRVSLPKGNFKLQKLATHRRVCLLAAGSGLTPFLGLLDHLLKRYSRPVEHLCLKYFNKTFGDIWCYEALTQLANSDERFHFVNILSQPDDNWTGLRGQISRELLAPLTDQTSEEFATYIVVCGPHAFNERVETILKEMEFPVAEDLYIFQG